MEPSDVTMEPRDMRGLRPVNRGLNTVGGGISLGDSTAACLGGSFG